MSKPSWMWLLLSVLTLAGCTRTTPNVDDANLSALLGAPSFAGKWRCRALSPGQHWYSRSTTLCDAEAKDSASQTLAQTTDEHHGGIQMVYRSWWNRDSTAWMARRDSIVHALFARFPDATPCEGPPVAYAPPPEPPDSGMIHDQRGWRSGPYDVVISIMGPTSKPPERRGPIYMLALNVAKAPSWELLCGTPAQWSKLPKPHWNTRSADTAHRH